MNYKKTIFRALLGMLLLPHIMVAKPEFDHSFEGDGSPRDALPFWVEIKGAEKSNIETVDGKLQVEVPRKGKLYYAIGTSNGNDRGAGVSAYNGSSPAGTTIDFSLTVSCSQVDQLIFGVHAGSDSEAVVISFAPGGIMIGKQWIPHDVTVFDTYRIAFDGNMIKFFSARSGQLYVRGRSGSSRNYNHNALFFGTLATIDVETPGAWTLDFIRWTNQGAEFSTPQ